jgi:hypothetical protein
LLYIDDAMQGQRCENQACLCRLHDFCVQTFFRGQSARKCPFCGEDWTGNSLVGDRARNRSRRSNAAGSRHIVMGVEAMLN